MPLRRLSATVAVLACAALGLAACGSEGVVRDAKTEGVYVEAGGLKYQVQVSRQLNAADFEDRDYLKGLPPADRRLRPGQEWFAVFIRVFNSSNAPHRAASRFLIRDTTGQVFRPVPINLDLNVAAYRPLTVRSGDQIPLPGSFARDNLAQGGLILFKVPVSAYANRPLEFRIIPPAGGPAARVDLDV